MCTTEANILIPSIDLLSWTFDNQDYDHAKPIFVDAERPERTLSAQQTLHLVRRFIAGFKTHGIEVGEVVCLHMFNDVLYPALVLGIIGAGACFTGSNPAYTADELRHHFSVSKTRMVITEAEHLPTVLAATNDCAVPPPQVLIFNPLGQVLPLGFLSFEVLLEHGESDWIYFDDDDRASTTTATLLSTSGTSGLHKMAVRTHKNLVAEDASLRGADNKGYDVSRLLCVPMFHAFAAPLAYVGPLRRGHLTYVMRRFDENLYLNTVSRFDISETAMVPPMLVRFLACSESNRLKLGSLRCIWCAGAPLDPDVQRRALSMFYQDARIVQVYGMTEAGWITTFLHGEQDSTGAVGRLIPGFAAGQALMDENGVEVHGEGQRGELCVKGPAVMRGYLGNAAATTNAFDSDGWLLTGDIAFRAGGKIYIVDRKKDLIKVRCWQVAPAELEGVLLKHERISDAAVIGCKDRSGEEIPLAYIVPKAGACLQEQEIKSFLLEHLAKYKVTDCQIKFAESIPKGSSGKILKKVLRAEALADADCALNLEALAPENVAASKGALEPENALVLESLLALESTLAPEIALAAEFLLEPASASVAESASALPSTSVAASALAPERVLASGSVLAPEDPLAPTSASVAESALAPENALGTGSALESSLAITSASVAKGALEPESALADESAFGPENVLAQERPDSLRMESLEFRRWSSVPVTAKIKLFERTASIKVVAVSI